ncbi:uncharacterized protein PHALS_03714 [Plasmopara halstedii]|uniref:RanBP2-type domain-containing protein n=1 Tax=Plasmopara halstedii TaxID=4781 RepID=A0A0P1AX77_PLAHL|nr:uncharacterized protein PHALS_03714 [Plasmopara halstedii]CEG47052.1 hypothetical protein PHALS_03714 [Plasmopara halstedii]|eukprot:XP_024583421.1 hypothetical protein PHALS_03714 [Plasmopara halstedii]
MSWQSQWGNVKASNARAAALYYEVSNVGKTIESSKKRVVWRLKVEEGRDFEISLTHSLASGKKVLRVDGIVKYNSQSLPFGDWDYVFNLSGGHCVHIIIKPSVDLNDMYDLIVDGISFRRLPNRLDPTKLQKSQDNGVTSASRTITDSGSRNGSFTYNYSKGGYNNGNYGNTRNSSRENSFSPWECTQCTLVNEKPHALICEACGFAKPDYISPESRQRAKSVALSPNPPPLRLAAKSAATGSIVFDMWNSSAPSTIPFPEFTDFDGFPVTSTLATKQQPQTQDITSMLSGLDFTPPPVEETSPPMENALDSLHTEEDQVSTRDLWSSDMVNLNLKPEDKNLSQRSAKSYQTLEQARQLAPKEKIQILPTPPPLAFPTYNSIQTPGSFNGGMAPPQALMYNSIANTGPFGMASSSSGFGVMQSNAMVPYGGFLGQQVSPFTTMTSMNEPLRQLSIQKMDNDPFATLS